MKEVWRVVTESREGYLGVSNLGRLRREIPGPGTWVGRIYRTSLTRGYPSISVRLIKRKVRRYVHHIPFGRKAK